MRFKKLTAAFMAATMVIGAFGSSLSFSPMSVDAATFTDLDQTEIVAEMGAGWNLGNQLEACISGVPYETAWGNPTITNDLIKAVKAAGFSTIRVPVSYLSKIGSDYTIDSSWLNRVQEVVDMCINNDLYVIINMHGDGYNSVDGGWLLCNGSDQTTIRAKYKACWQQIATKFKDYDEHLIFESMNEEFDGTYGTPNTTYYSNINELNQIFVDTVRQTGGNNNMRWLLVPGWNTNIEYTAGNYGFEIPSDNYLSSSVPSGEKRIMISVHYYDPWGFCGEESSTTTQWGSSATDSSKVASYGDESYLNSQFYNLYSAFTSKGYPVVIGEYGAIDKSAYDSNNTACRIEWTKKVCTYAKQYGCVPVWWDNGYTGTYGFALFDRTNYTVTQQSIIDAIIGVMGTGSSSSGSSGSGSGSSSGTTTGTVIFSNGSSDQSYSTSDASWLTNASDSAVITLKYTCTDSSHSYWGILGWGASVDGNWVNGSSYAASSNATDTVTVTFTAGELKDSLGITSSSSVGYLALSAYNGGQIISLSIADSSSSDSGSSDSGSSDSGSSDSGSSDSGSSDSGNSSTTTTIELNANNLTKGTYTSDYTYGDFTIGASSSKYISVESTSATINGTTYSQRLKMNGAANSTGRYIKFTTSGAATVEVIGISTSTSATRVIRLAKDSVGGTTVGDITVSGTAGVQSISISEAGTYYLYSTNSGIYVYDVKVSSSASSSSSGSSSDSSSSTSSSLEGVYYIKNVHSGKYLDIADDSSANSANVQQWTFDGSNAQKFKIVDDGDGYFHILTAISGYSKCVDVAGAKADNGTNILQYTYKGSTNQQFKFELQSDGSYAILTRASNCVGGLDVYNWSTEDGGNINQWEFWGGNCQKWILEKAE